MNCITSSWVTFQMLSRRTDEPSQEYGIASASPLLRWLLHVIYMLMAWMHTGQSCGTKIRYEYGINKEVIDEYLVHVPRGRYGKNYTTNRRLYLSVCHGLGNIWLWMANGFLSQLLFHRVSGLLDGGKVSQITELRSDIRSAPCGQPGSFVQHLPTKNLSTKISLLGIHQT